MCNLNNFTINVGLYFLCKWTEMLCRDRKYSLDLPMHKLFVHNYLCQLLTISVNPLIILSTIIKGEW